MMGGVGGFPLGPGPMGSISTIRTNIPNLDDTKKNDNSGFSFMGSGTKAVSKAQSLFVYRGTHVPYYEIHSLTHRLM